MVIVSSTIFSLLAGCGSPNSDTESAAQVGNSSVGAWTNANSQEANGLRRLDAGIIFADQASYLCVPLEELGIASAEQIRSIETSCECLEARTVTYQQSPTKMAEALRLDFVPKITTVMEGDLAPKPIERNRRPTRLATIVTIELRSGKKLDLTVKFLLTVEHLAHVAPSDGVS